MTTGETNDERENNGGDDYRIQRNLIEKSDKVEGEDGIHLRLTLPNAGWRVKSR